VERARRGAVVAAIAAITAVAFVSGAVIGLGDDAPSTPPSTTALTSAPSTSSSVEPVSAGRLEIPPESGPYD